ncbi:MAG: hypothetical protein H7Y88_08410 [Phycisphaerales bacterium]|nr:hypothetical protein [Phycisphaerales bacterium]
MFRAIATAALIILACRSAAAQTYTGGSISIPLNSPSAAPFPSTINVANGPALIDRVVVTLRNVWHTYPSDLNIVLQSPGGPAVMLMSDAGGEVAVTGATLTFSLTASLPVPAPMTGGVYAVTNIDEDLDAGPPPMPATPAGSLEAFRGYNANGQWKLFVFDDFAAIDGGQIGSWEITFESGAHNPAPIEIPLGFAAPANYPSVICADVPGEIIDLDVEIHGLVTPFGADVSLLLVGPGGKSCVLMANHGFDSEYIIAEATVIFDDESPPLPVPVVSGRFRPQSALPFFLAPAPLDGLGASLSAFDGQSASGVYALFVLDTFPALDPIAITGGWAITINGRRFCSADYNRNGAVQSSDITSFLSEWFTQINGCP